MLEISFFVIICIIVFAFFLLFYKVNNHDNAITEILVKYARKYQIDSLNDNLTDDYNKCNKKINTLTEKINSLSKKEITINLNDNCTVVLSETGAVYLNKINEMCNSKFYNKSISYRVKTDYVQGDEYKAQLWSIIEMFGPALNIGEQAPFVDCKLTFKGE